MRTLLTFSILILFLCTGCLPTVPKSDDEAAEELIVTPDFNKPVPLVEKLIPRVDPPATTTPPEEPKAEPGDSSETTSGIPAQSLRKYAAAVVPLPPIEDLITQVNEYIKKIGQSLESLDGSPRYAADAGDIVRDTNALALIALAIGLSETDSIYKKSASQIIAAARNLAAAKNLEDGQKAYEALKASLTSTDTGKPLSWSDKVAVLTPAMKALPNLSSAIKRVTNTEGKLNVILDQQAQQVFGQIAAMAVISQGCIPNVTETTKPDAVAEWKKHCEDFRDAALKVNAVTRQYAQDRTGKKEHDYAAFTAAFKTMAESCDDCHRTFYPNAIGTQ